MEKQAYRAIRGTFVAGGYAPDGDSIRFAADRASELDTLSGSLRLRFANDTSVQLRLEGIDAPELHYLARAQRCADIARDALLRALGIGGARIVHDYVEHAELARGTILARGVDVNGRVIAYAFTDGAALDIARSVNATLLRDGMAYPLAYDTQPEVHRALFASFARAARRAGTGIWQHDRTGEFRLASAASIGVRGALIFPKLFRRCVAFLTDRFSGFRGGIREWLESEGGPVNDVVIVGRRLRRLSELIAEGERSVTTRTDAMKVVFVAR
jgi:endonuclease YncB( thermonuclease family)